MPEAPTSNIGSSYYNNNECRSFNIKVSTAMTRLSGVDSAAPFLGQLCSEVYIVNKTGQTLSLFDRAEAWGDAEAINPSRAFILSDGESVTLMGLTNVNQVSAKTGASNGFIYYRTQYFSSNPIR